MMLLLLSHGAVAKDLTATTDAKSPSYSISILQNFKNDSINLQFLEGIEHLPIGPSFSTLNLPSVFFIRVQILKKNGNQKFFLSIFPSFSSVDLIVYSNALIDGVSQKSLIEGGQFPRGDNYFELQMKEGVEEPVFFIKVNKKFTQILSVDVLNTSDFKSQKFNQIFNTGLYIGVAGVFLLLITFFYVKYKKRCLITLLITTILLFIGGIFRDPHFTEAFFPLSNVDDQIYYLGIFYLIHRSSFSLFLAFFLLDFSKNQYLRYIGVINFIYSLILVATYIGFVNFSAASFSAINLAVNLFILVFCLTSELRKQSRSKKLYLLVWPGVFMSVFLLALFYNLIPVPPGINYYELEWFRIYYTAMFIYILYTFYSSELSLKDLKIRESELLLLSQVRAEVELRNEQEELNKVISHELKTPLTALYFLIDRLEILLLKKSDLIDSTLSKMKLSAQQINSVTDRFSWLSLFNTFEISKISNNINILSVIQGITEVSGQEKRFRITGSDQIAINTDLFYLTTILQNLIDNALKYSLPDSVVNIDLHQDDAYLILNISNLIFTNHRIDSTKIFDKYYRGIGSGGNPGLGIGLWLVKRIGAKIGISINAIVDNEEIVFCLTIPVSAEKI